MVSSRGKIKLNFLPDQICQKIIYFLALKWQQKKQPKSRLKNIDLPPPPGHPWFHKKKSITGRRANNVTNRQTKQQYTKENLISASFPSFARKEF